MAHCHRRQLLKDLFGTVAQGTAGIVPSVGSATPTPGWTNAHIPGRGAFREKWPALNP
jgi:hypothetical protein